MYTREEVIQMLREYVEDCGSQKEAASKIGISAQYMNDLMRGRRSPGPAVLETMKLKRVMVYERFENVEEEK
jgi:hypothetical protein